MQRWTWLMVLALAAPLSAQQQGPEDLLKRAQQLAASGDAAGAVELLSKAAAMPNAAGEVSLELGRLQQSRLEFDAAIAAYQAAAAALSGAAQGEALGRMAVAQEVRGVGPSPATVEAALAASPEGPWPLLAAARARAREGQGEAALALAQKAKAAGGGAAADAAIGYAEEARGELAAAEAAYRAAVAADSGDPSANIGLARVLRLTGRAQQGEPLVQQILAKGPGAVDAHKELARLKVAMGRAGEAVADAAVAAALAENDPDAQRLVEEVTVAKALELVAADKVEQAVGELLWARDRSPDSAIIRLGLARALLARRQTDAALAELQKAVELEPRNAEAQFQLGRVIHRMKAAAAAAVAPLEKAVAAAPANVEYRTALGVALSDAKQYERSIEVLEKASAAPGYARADGWISLGASQLALKRYADAAAALEKGVGLAPDNAQAEAYLGWAYFGLKDADNFKKHAGKARALGYKEPTLLDYLKRIEAGEPIK